MYNKTIIFCQAPADVPYVLDIYEKKLVKNTIFIFVINVEGLYTFLSSLNLNIGKLAFIPYELKNLKNIHCLFNERKRINKLWENNFNQLKNCDVYFFSRFEDWLTAAFIHRFAKKKNIKIWYADHYDDSSLLFKNRTMFNFRILIYQFILKFLTGVKFKTQITEKLPEFPVSNYGIRKITINLNSKIHENYNYQIKDIDQAIPNILFFVSPCEKSIFNPLSYDSKLIETIQYFKNIGYRITIKGHPRIGIQASISHLMDQEIPSYIPGEFINSNQFELCFGIYTTAICHYVNNTNLPTYSLMKLFEASNPETYKIGIKYLIQQTDGKIQFCESIEELVMIAKDIRRKFDERQ